ncbi:MAG: helix-hairpin-helix domain-containing protein [Granulosicoccaceae bacterium]
MAICQHTLSFPILQISFSVFLKFFVTTGLVLAGSGTAAYAAEPLNVNLATASQLESYLPGIGKVKAQAIVDYRNRNGPFDGPEQLLEIKGVGSHTLDRIRSLIKFDSGRALFFSQASQQHLDARDQAIREGIKRIVTRAKKAAHN